ncbi:hypothetical protein JIP62_08615 [Brevundimonas vitis]|uniref:Transposase n=1 Tax=Brevundimonas vitisensis TaxID=2800818 RepID=A0ABX7BIP7_9CAUL|nr:hypothetical protein [Brevundimonas vitisensis]QQQ17420.1 hypothetical protein JIP62_08615 [Brevundimonas vitisensis]
MRLKDIIKAEKSAFDLGKWQYGHIPRHAFPQSKVKESAYKFGRAYSWRIVRFTALGRRIRVKIVLNESKEIFRAKLGVEEGGDMIVLCEHEFHSSEPGWHCHFTTKPLNSVVAGTVRAGKRKRPTAIDASAVFNVTEATAFDIAAKRYGFDQKGSLL